MTETATTDLLKIGRVTKAHGLRGEVVVQLWTDQTQRLTPGTVLSSASGPLEVVASKLTVGDRYIVQFASVHDRVSAERLRGLELEAEPLDDAEAPPGTLWVHELVGALVRDAGGTELGRVTAVEANPASDLMVLESGGLIPVRFVIAHDAATQTVDVDIPEGLLDP
ncbi:MAG TPA: ribosome maturation factor RimM [Acidimicrobiales bacterium]|nr:ribosome maturation factor RimM [Acidimicrobiales bacterium]